MGIAISKKNTSLDDLVSKYVPELAKSAWEPVQIRHLIDMTSGVYEHNSTNNPDLFNDVYPRTDPEAVLKWSKMFEKVADPSKKSMLLHSRSLEPPSMLSLASTQQSSCNLVPSALP